MFGTEGFFKQQHMGLLCPDDCCSVYQMKNETGDGIATFYPVYPGISVMYSDFHMTECQPRHYEKNIILISITAWKDEWNRRLLTEPTHIFPREIR